MFVKENPDRKKKKAQCVTKRDISRRSHVFQIVHKIVSCQGTVVNNIEALCILQCTKNKVFH